jgi:hypothetical protein
MIKDIAVNLPVGPVRDVATDFAVSVASTFDAHLAGIAFGYEPLVPMMADMYGIPSDVIESQRIENEKAAKAAASRFDDAAKRAAVSAEARIRRSRSRALRMSSPVSRAGSSCRSSASLSPTSLRPTSLRSTGSLWRRRYSTPAAPCSSSPTFNAPA